MLYLSSKDKAPTLQERAYIMRKHIERAGIPIDYDRLLEYYADAKVREGELGSILLKVVGSTNAIFKAPLFKNWITANGITKGFDRTPKGYISFNKTSINNFLNANQYDKSIMDIVRMFSEWNTCTTNVSFIPSILEEYRPSGLETEDGRRLILVKPGVELQNTGRFGLTNPAVMNFPRYMKDLYAAPKGWRLLSADSGQIEPRLIYGFYIPDKQIQKLIELYNDAYYGVLHYCRMPQEFIDSGTLDFTPNEITPELKELRQRLKTYGNGVMYGSTSNPDNDPLKESFIRRIGQHPYRLSWEESVKANINSGARYVNTLFNTQIDIYESDKVKNAKDDKERFIKLVHCAINNPIQGTAGDLMAFSLRATDELLSKKAPNSWITKFVHDEGQYCICNDEWDYVLEELSGMTAYCIDERVFIYNDAVTERHINKSVISSYSSLNED